MKINLIEIQELRDLALKATVEYKFIHSANPATVIEACDAALLMEQYRNRLYEIIGSAIPIALSFSINVDRNEEDSTVNIVKEVLEAQKAKIAELTQICIFHRTTQEAERRDYFMGHAPDVPPSWFKPVMRAVPTLPNRTAELTPEQQANYDGADEDYCPAVADFSERWKRACAELAVWKIDFERERYVQWPLAWANAMLEASSHE